MVEGKINRSAVMQPDGARIKSFSAILAGSEGTGESVLENGELPGRHLLSHSGLCNREGAGGKREGGRGCGTGGKRWCENTLLRETVGPSFRRFNCFVLAAREGRTERETVGPLVWDGRGWRTGAV